MFQMFAKRGFKIVMIVWEMRETKFTDIEEI